MTVEFHHPCCARFEEDANGRRTFMAECDCAALAEIGDELTAELGDTIETLAPSEFGHKEIQAEVLAVTKTGRLKVRAVSGEEHEGKTLLVPVGRCFVTRKAA